MFYNVIKNLEINFFAMANTKNNRKKSHWKYFYIPPLTYINFDQLHNDTKLYSFKTLFVNIC